MRAVKLIEYDLKPHIEDDQVTAIQVDPVSTKIVISLKKTGQCCEILLTQNIMKSSFLKNSVTTCIELCPMRVVEQGQDDAAKITVIRFAQTQNSQVLLILGYSNGRIKIINARSHKVIMNMKSLNDQSAVTALDVCLEGANLKIYCGTQSGHVVQILINNKESKVVKGKQICLQPIKQITSDGADTLFILSSRQILSLDKQTFSVKQKFDIQNQKALNPKDSFSQFALVNLDGKNKALACFLQT